MKTLINITREWGKLVTFSSTLIITNLENYIAATGECVSSPYLLPTRAPLLSPYN